MLACIASLRAKVTVNPDLTYTQSFCRLFITIFLLLAKSAGNRKIVLLSPNAPSKRKAKPSGSAFTAHVDSTKNA
jgi:hypothetical protein